MIGDPFPSSSRTPLLTIRYPSSPSISTETRIQISFLFLKKKSSIRLKFFSQMLGNCSLFVVYQTFFSYPWFSFPVFTFTFLEFSTWSHTWDLHLFPFFLELILDSWICCENLACDYLEFVFTVYVPFARDSLNWTCVFSSMYLNIFPW